MVVCGGVMSEESQKIGWTNYKMDISPLRTPQTLFKRQSSVCGNCLFLDQSPNSPFYLDNHDNDRNITIIITMIRMRILIRMIIMLIMIIKIMILVMKTYTIS